MRKNRDTETFSLSFLDAITCAFGAIILLLVLTKIYEPQIIERSQENPPRNRHPASLALSTREAPRYASANRGP